MANITNEINNINNAIYGEEVRGSISSALTKMNSELNNAIGDQLLTVDATLSAVGQGADAEKVGYIISNSSGRIVAREYSSSTEYAVGDYCIYNQSRLSVGTLYKCITATTGSFNSSCWTAVKIADEIKRLNDSTKVDATLSNVGKPADAEKVGSVIYKAGNIVASPHLTSTQYVAGDYCLYNQSRLSVGKVYKCLEDTSGAWDSSKWQAVTPMGEIIDLKSTTEESVADLRDEISKQYLLLDEIPDTTQTYTFSGGAVSQVVHSRNNTIIRTDAFTYATNSITEVRTLNTGESLTIVTNLTTLETTITYSANDYELLYTITGFAKCIGYVILPQNRYNSDPSETAACASLDSYSLQVGDKIKFEGDTNTFTFGIGTNNPDASSDGNWKIPLSTPYEYVIEASHLQDCRVVDIRKKDSSTISTSELAAINQSVKVYRKENS